MIVLMGLLLITCNQQSTKAIAFENDLTKLENDWMHAMMSRDQSKLDEIVATEFTVTGMKYLDTPAVSRNMWMQNTMQNLKIDSVHFINIKVSTVDDVGIVRAQFFWSGAYDTDHFSDTTSFVDTWIKKESGWRVVSRIVTDPD